MERCSVSVMPTTCALQYAVQLGFNDLKLHLHLENIGFSRNNYNTFLQGTNTGFPLQTSYELTNLIVDT